MNLNGMNLTTNLTMKLSEAMRLGSTLLPQGFGLFRDHEITACAMDAAFIATGDRKKYGNSANWPDSWAAVCRRNVPCPECGYRASGPLPLVAIIACHLNDGHRWSRERIADFVETLELELEMNAAPEPIRLDETQKLANEIPHTDESVLNG